MKKFAMSICVLTLTTNAMAVECTDVIKKCDETIAEKNKTIELKDLAVRNCLEHGISVQYQLNETKAELAAWYHNPVILIPLGILGGIAASKYLLNK